MTFEEIKQKVAESGISLPCCFKTEDGENGILSQGCDLTNHYFRTEVSQKNGWTRFNDYWEDGTTEEWYKK